MLGENHFIKKTRNKEPKLKLFISCLILKKYKRKDKIKNFIEYIQDYEAY